MVWLSLNSKFPPCDFFFYQKLDCPLLRLESYLTKFCFCSWSNMNPSLFNHFQEKWCTIKSHSIFSISYAGCVDEVTVSVQNILRSLLRNLNFIFTYTSSCWHDMVHGKCWIWILKIKISIENQIWMESVWYEFLRFLRSLLKTKGGWKQLRIQWGEAMYDEHKQRFILFILFHIWYLMLFDIWFYLIYDAAQ